MVAWSSADGRLPTGDGNSDGCIRTGFQRWNMDGYVEDQYETFNGMPVYYGGDLYDSEDSDWDDPYALAIYQTVSYATKDEWNTSDNDSLTVAADENDPDMNEFYQRVVSSDDENYLDSDNGSVTDFDSSMSEGAYCVVSDDGSAADLDVDMLDIVDYDDSDVWSVTDFSSCSSGVDVEDDCDFNMISVVDREMYFVNVDTYAYCALLARRIYGLYGMGPWIKSGWTIRVMLPGTRVLRILGL